MTEAEAKAIEFVRDGFRVRLYSGHDLAKMPATEADLLAAGYLPAYRLLAVEAELGRVKAERAHLEEAASLLEWVALECRIEGTPEIHRAVGEWQSRNVDRNQAAPPSPPVAPELRDFDGDGGLMPGDQWRDAVERALGVEPDPIEHTPSWAYERVLAKREIGNGVRNESGPVAPEPAQENQGPLGQKENDNGKRNDRSATTEQREAGDAGLVRSEADSARDDRFPEGGAEVAGESIGHHQARRSADVGRRSDDARVAELEAKVAELEQERADLHGALGDTEHAARVAETEAEVRRLALVVANGDRDAERTQREAALLEVSRLSFELGKAQGEAEGHALTRRAVESEKEALRVELEQWKSIAAERERNTVRTSTVVEALRAENEGLKALACRWQRRAKDVRTDDEGGHLARVADCLEECADEIEAIGATKGAHQPAEAAPVANGEPIDDEGVMVVAKAEAPSEPVAWVPKVGDRVARIGRGFPFYGVVNRIDETRPDLNHWVSWQTGSEGNYDAAELEPAPQPPATTGVADRRAGGIVIEYSDGSSEAYALERKRP